MKIAGYFFIEQVLIENHSININKNLNMKKFFFVLAIGAFAACNNSSSTEAKTDSPKAAVDSPKAMVDSPKVAGDSGAKKMDSPAKKVDSPAKK